MNQVDDLDRRGFLRRMAAVGAAGFGIMTASGCGGGEAEEAVDAAGPAAESDFTCTDVSGLSEPAVQMRETLEYVDESPYEDRVCENCQFWVPAEAGEQCGGCTIMQGPIHPLGYCNSWAEQIA